MYVLRDLTVLVVIRTPTMPSQSALHHRAKIAARTRSINEAKNHARGIEKKPRRRPQEVDVEREASGGVSRNHTLGTHFFHEASFWKGPNKFVDTDDARRVFRLRDEYSETLGAGTPVWFDFKLASSKKQGGVAPEPNTGDRIRVNNPTTRDQYDIIILKKNVSLERSRTGACECHVLCAD